MNWPWNLELIERITTQVLAIAERRDGYMDGRSVLAMAEKPKQSVLFGQTEITYRVNACDRKTLAIHVYPDGQSRCRCSDDGQS